jgi:predicted methyltransferase
MRLAVLSLALAALVAPAVLAAHCGGAATTSHHGGAAPAAANVDIETGLAPILAGDWRPAAHVARDDARNPAATLAFFGIQPGMTVVEVSPGGGWYTDLLAPWLRGQGRLVAALNDPARAPNERAAGFFTRQNQALRERLAAHPAVFDRVHFIEVDPAAPVYGEPGSADAVLTFRNLHGWIRNGQAEAQMRAFFAVLKPGSVLGVEQHRALVDVPPDQIQGYVSEAQVIALAEAAGFVLEARSEINANPRDDRDHPNGVWTLPPTLNVPEGEDRAKYEAIGESDRMTLRFRKPKA